MKLPIAPLLALALAPLAAHASDLTVDGVTSTTVSVADSFQLSLTGNPGLPARIYGDVDPGPTVFAGEAVPLGLTSHLMLLVAGTTDGAGVLSSPYFLPDDSSLAGLTIHLGGFVLDPSDPNGFDVSNGASFQIVPKAGAGASQSVLVGRRAVLDGSGALEEDGTLAAGTSVFWELLDLPPGSVAALENPTDLYPFLVPDVPGDYRVRVTVTLGGAMSSAETRIHAYRIDLFPPLDGEYVVPPSVTVQGAVEGPDLGSLQLGGQALAVGPGGDFGPVTVSLAAGEVFLPLSFEVANTDGSTARERQSVAQGTPAPLSLPSSQSLAARVNQLGYDVLETAAEETLLSVDIASLLVDQGPIELANDEGPFGITLFSAYVEFTDLTYSSINVELTPATGGVGGLVQIFGVDADFHVYGEVIEIPYDLQGDMTSNPADISGVLALSVSGGVIDADMQGTSVDLKNFGFDLSGFIGSVAELFIIEEGVKDSVEAAVAAAVEAEFPPALEAILSSFVLSGNLFGTLEVDVDVAAPIGDVVGTLFGTTILLDGSATVASAEPGSPPVDQYRSTPGGAAVFGLATPGGGAYGAALGVGDDFLNQVLAAATGAGLLDGDMLVLFGEEPGGVGDLLFTDVLDTLFPGAGFDKLPAGTAVDMRAHGTMPPIVRTTPGGPALGVIDMADLEVRFEVPDHYGPGEPLQVLLLTVDARAELDLFVDVDGTLVATLGETTVAAQAVQGFPGSNLVLLNAGIDFLASILVPQLTDLFAGIPIPSLSAQGFGLVTSEIALIGAGEDHLGFFGDLVLTAP